MRQSDPLRPVVPAMIKRPPWTLPVIVFAQFAGTSIWFSGNAVLAELMQRWSSSSPMAGWITSAVQVGFIAGTLVFAIFAVSDRFSPRWVFLLCAVAGSLSNIATATTAGKGNSLADLGFIQEYIEDLPYTGEVMGLSLDDWQSWSTLRQVDFINRLEEKVSYYRALHDHTDLWVSLGGGPVSGDSVYPVPLEMLP